MRFLMPAVAAATALTIGLAPAAAQSQRNTHHERTRSHVSLHLSTHTVLAGNGLAVRGKVRPSGRHRVKVVFRGPEGGVRGVTTRADGTFAVRWTPERTGSYAVRAYGVHDRRVSGSRSTKRKLTSYRLAGASYYGPGLYGNGVACGGTLLPRTMGVAHKTLPCGTKVKLRYHGRSVTVPVIDRGPYVAGRDYDLTEAVKERLGFPGLGTVLATR
ncbi:MAG TPA: septal ring lytic transglycosylase RlpA family protein [Solirubrobacterales bacterium]